MSQNSNFKRSSKTAGNSLQKSKVHKPVKNRIDYNEFFSNCEHTAEKQSSSKDFEPKSGDTMAHVQKSTSNPSIIGNENEENVLSTDQLTQMLENMSAAFVIAVKHLKSACEAIHLCRTKSTLAIRETKVTEADLPLLTMFEQYNLPLKTKEEVEKLEAELEMSDDFLKFFVGSKLLTFVSYFVLKSSIFNNGRNLNMIF